MGMNERESRRNKPWVLFVDLTGTQGRQVLRFDPDTDARPRDSGAVGPASFALQETLQTRR